MNRMKKISKTDFWVLIGIMIIIVVISSFLRPIYMKYLDKNIQVRICATAKKSSEALANNVRIAHVTVNGKDINLAKIDLPDPWQYDSKNDFIYVYNLEKQTDLMFELENVHKLEVTFVKEVGSGYVDVYLDGQLYTNIDLYEECEWNEISISKETSLWVFPERHLIFWLLTFVCSVVFTFILKYTSQYYYRIQQGSRIVVVTWLSSIFIVACSVCIQYQSLERILHYLEEQTQLVIESVVFVFLLTVTFYYIIQRLWICHIISGLIIIMIGIINQLKLLNRGIALLPWDFDLVLEAGSVIERYQIQISEIEIASIFLFVLSVVVLGLFETRTKHKWKGRLAGIGLLGMGITALFVNTHYVDTTIEESNADYRVYQVNAYYEKRGLIPAFLEYLTYAQPGIQPEKYDKNQVEQVAKKVIGENKNGDQQSDNRPTIIAIMSESFWDVSRLDTIEVEEPLFPSLEALRDESIYGNAYSHVINGGTVISEFEFLTGFTGEFFPEDYMIYGKYLHNRFDSVVSLLKKRDYKTIALHPYKSENYNRKTAYENLGFDKLIFDKDFENPLMIRNYISDKSLFERIISEYEKENNQGEEPLFIFAVTMQNHGGYWKELTTEESTVRFTNNVYKTDTEGSLTDMLAGLHESDKAFGELISYFQKVDDEIIVIYFGDHVSDAGTKDDRVLAKTSWNTDSAQYIYETHLVPFIIWNNHKKNNENKGVIEIGQILPIAFDEFGIKTNHFFDFLLNKSDVYAATGNSIIVHSQGDYENIANINESEREWYTSYELLQYDYIFGKQYASYLWN